MRRYTRRHTVRVRRHGRFNIRKFISSLMPFVLLLTLTLPVSAAEQEQPAAEQRDAGEKLTEGVGDTATGWVEVPQEMIDTSKESNPIEGVTVGTIKGAGKAVVKTTEGAVDTGTFYIPDEKKEPAETEEAPAAPEAE